MYFISHDIWNVSVAQLRTITADGLCQIIGERFDIRLADQYLTKHKETLISIVKTHINCKNIYWPFKSYGRQRIGYQTNKIITEIIKIITCKP